MAIAITAMGELNKYIGDTKEHGLNKSVLCQSLALRPFLKQCSNFHKNMYSRLLYAEPELFRECVKLYATEEDITKRNNLLFEWFGFKRLDLVPPDTERAVQKLFGWIDTIGQCRNALNTLILLTRLWFIRIAYLYYIFAGCIDLARITIKVGVYILSQSSGIVKRT